MLALLSIVTKYKTKKITKRRFRLQTTFWIITLILLVVSFPIYNYLAGNNTFESTKLTVFDIIQTTVIFYLVYAFTNIQQKLDTTNRRLQDLHQELSIILSTNDKK